MHLNNTRKRYNERNHTKKQTIPSQKPIRQLPNKQPKNSRTTKHYTNRLRKHQKNPTRNRKQTRHNTTNTHTTTNDQHNTNTRTRNTQRGTTMKVTIDSREKDRVRSASKYFKDQGLEVEVSELKVGDYLFDDKVCFEYKTIPDFIASIQLADRKSVV